MRHKKRRTSLNRDSGKRQALLCALARAIFLHERVITTVAKAKEARRVVERLITLGKRDTIPARRQAYKVLRDRHVLRILFESIAPAFVAREGGYTRILRLNKRLGDGAQMVYLELVEKPFELHEEEPQPEEKKKKKTTKKSKTAKEGKAEKETA